MDFKIAKILLLVSFFAWFPTSIWGQAKKPTLMVVPSDLYCIERGYTRQVDNNGIIETVPDYKIALQNDPQLLIVTTEIGRIMSARGFPLKSLEMELKSIANSEVEDALLTSKSGADIAETPYDKIRKRAKCDIILSATCNINNFGPKKSVTFVLQGLDSYTNKQIAACQGTGPQSFATELPILIEEAVINEIPAFEDQLQNHFQDLFENGREITIKCKRWDDSDWDFESDTSSGELGEVIENWIQSNAVKGRYSLSEATESVLNFEQIRIPMFDHNGRALDARLWARGLTKYLSGIGIPSKLVTKGLGQVLVVIGGK